MSDVLETTAITSRLSSLEKTVNSNSATLNNNIKEVSKQLTETKKELAKLQKDFEKMVDEQRKTSALQQATTELVSVRQELEKKFGNYRIIRNTMVGILQATDAALVRKVTISNVSEELMISTPDYWLAPVLVALAAWINNNRDLAERAIREAVKRDNEHTSLVMALICRRNNRTETCYEWLARYFSTQNAANFDEDGMVYIDAYINNVFGPDKKHMCDAYVTRWIDEIRGSSSTFEDEQTETWDKYFVRFTVTEGDKYPALKKYVQEYGYIDQYLSRVDAAEDIRKKFCGIDSAYIDQEALKKTVDEHLLKLVQADDKAERTLREQEKYLLAVKACQGDVDTARTMVNKQRDASRRQTMNIVERMTHVISDEKDVRPSVRKTAYSFLRSYINKGYNKYFDEKRSDYPETITLHVDGWEGRTKDGSNEQEMVDSYSEFLQTQKEAEAASLEKAKSSKLTLYAGLGFVALGFLMIIAGAFAGGTITAAGVGVLIMGGILFAVNSLTRSRAVHQIANIDAKYQQQLVNGKQTIHDCVSQWKVVNSKIIEFEANRPEEITA